MTDKIPKELPSTPAYFKQRDKLPEDLRGDFDELVKWYRFYAFCHHTRPFVSYKILADLVREGYRKSAESVLSR